MNIRPLTALCFLLLAGCTTTFDNSKVDYKSKGTQAPTLEVPPDLSLLTKNTQALVPASGAANANAYQSSAAAKSVVTNSAVATNTLGDVRVMREGTQRWLLVENRSPEQLWDELKKFWIDNGFSIVVDQPNLGILETDWNENRAKLPQDGVRKYLGKILDGLFSTNERDKYRTRVERTPAGGSEIFIIHRGLLEDFVDSSKTRLAWKPRATDPELEIEFLKRLMLRLGAAQDIANVALDPAKPSSPTTDAPTTALRASIEQSDGQSRLILPDTFDQAWRRVGLALDRTNFTVEDRDRSKGVYFVRYVDSDAAKNEPGFFAGLFGAKAKESLKKYQVIVTANANQTHVQVADINGKTLNAVQANSILKILQDDLK